MVRVLIIWHNSTHDAWSMNECDKVAQLWRTCKLKLTWADTGMMTVIVTAPLISVSIHCCCSATLKERMALGSFKPLDNMPTNSLARLHRGGGGGGGGEVWESGTWTCSCLCSSTSCYKLSPGASIHTRRIIHTRPPQLSKLHHLPSLHGCIWQYCVCIVFVSRDYQW